MKASIEFARVGDDDVMRWTCPRCKARMEQEIDWEGPVIGLTAVMEIDEPDTSPRRGIIDALCDCGRAHEHRPDVGTGCGYGARVRVEVP